MSKYLPFGPSNHFPRSLISSFSISSCFFYFDTEIRVNHNTSTDEEFRVSHLFWGICINSVSSAPTIFLNFDVQNAVGILSFSDLLAFQSNQSARNTHSLLITISSIWFLKEFIFKYVSCHITFAATYICKPYISPIHRLFSFNPKKSSDACSTAPC